MGMPLCNILYKQEGTQFAYATYAAQQKLFYALFSSEKVLLNANGWYHVLALQTEARISKAIESWGDFTYMIQILRVFPVEYVDRALQ